MKAFKYVLFLILILFIGTAIYVAVQPNDYQFSRSRVIEAPVPVVFDKVNELKDWPSFSPWIEQDPEANLNFKDTTSGVGAGYSWNGEILGEGSMSIVDVEKDKNINQQIEFVKPFESQSNINWDFQPVENGTKVTWSMQGEQDFMTKLYTTFNGSIEKNTAPDFERGLFKLDSITQAEMKAYSITVNGITEHSGGFYLYNTTSTKMDNFEAKMKEMLPEVSTYAMTNNITRAGKPFVYYHKWDEENNSVMFSCCVPTTAKVITNDENILTGQLAPFKAVKTTLKGDYSNLREAWEKTMTYISEQQLEFTDTNGPMLEVYLSDPMHTPNPADWTTEIYIAVK